MGGSLVGDWGIHLEETEETGEQVGLVAQPAFILAGEKTKQITARADSFLSTDISDFIIANEQ